MRWNRRLPLALVVVLMVACSSDGGDASPADTTAADTANPSDAGGDVSAPPEDALTSDSAAETSEDTSALAPLFANPHDGRLYAAAASAIITPNDENHPCEQYLAGTSSNRRPESVHDDLEARVLVLEKDGVHLVLASLDLIGWEIPDVDRIMDALEPYGVDRRHILISSTHTHTGPDTIGVFGPSELETGRCPEYGLWLRDTIVEMVTSAAPQMVPVRLYATGTEIVEPDAVPPGLINDLRIPYVTNPSFVVARLDDDEGETVATMVNWHSHPETMIEHDVYSADFPRWTREKLEQELGGTAIYFTGTLGGMMTPIDVHVPLRTASGEPVLVEGQPTLVEESGEEKAWSLGYIVAEQAIAALDDATEIDGTLSVATERIEVPFENIVFVVGFQSGVLEHYDELIIDQRERCGIYGCLPVDVHHIQLGQLHIVSLPGEVFPELSVGREEETHDWSVEYGDEWGPHTYPAITGYRASLPEGHLLMELGLTNFELGYILPQGDYLPNGHPKNYEEYFSVSQKTAEMLHAALVSLLSDSTE